MIMLRGTRFALVPLLLFAAACSRDPKADSHRLVENGNKFYNRGKLKEASIMYRRALAKDAKNADAYYKLGLTSIKLQAWSDAARALRNAVDLQPNNADAATKLADLYWTAYVANSKSGKGLVGEIKELSDALLKRDPKSFDGLRLSGYLHLADSDVAARARDMEEAKKEMASALARFEEANKVKPYDPQLALVLTSTLMLSGRVDDAEKLAKEVIERNKNYAAIYDRLLEIYLRTNRTAEAEKVLLLKVKNNPGQEFFRLQLAGLYLGTQRKQDMEKTLQDMINDGKDFPMARLTVGKFFARAGDFDRARREFDAGMNATPKAKADYQKAIIELLSTQGKFVEATTLVNDVLKANPKDSVALELRSALAIQSGDKQQIATAVNDLQMLVSKDPTNAVMRLQLGKALMAKGQPDQARAHLEEAIRLRPDLLPAKLFLSQIFVNKGDYARSLALTDEILSADQRNMAARLVRTSALLGTGDRTKAKNELEAIVKTMPNSADARFQLGYINYTEKNYPEAERHFRELQKANPNDNRGVVGILETYVAQKNFKGAIELTEGELAKDPSRQDVRQQLASVLARAGQYDEAIKQFQILLEKNPKSDEYEVRLAETYRIKGDFNSAVDHFKKASALAPNSVVPLMRVALLLDSVGRRPEAKPLYEQIIRLEPDNVVALNNLAYIKAEEGSDLDQALSYAQRAKQRVPQNADISDTLGWIYIKKNLSDDAVRVFKELIAQKPDNSTYHYHLAMALFQKGDRPTAKQECLTALKNSPSKEEQVKIKALMEKIG